MKRKKPKNRFSKNLIILRDRMGITQEQFAACLGITRARVGGWEEDRNEPNMDTLIKIAHFFRVSVTNLITYRYK